MLWRQTLTGMMLAMITTIVWADTTLLPEHQRESAWYLQAQTAMQTKPVFQPQAKAKNIILFVGDGMGVSTITAARILDGQNKGLAGEENRLSFEHFPFTGLAKTYNVDAQTPDSAGTMTAIITGVKTDAGIIAIDEKVERGDCTTVTGNELVSALELAELAGRSTGFVTTTRVTHATPAATYAKSPERNWEDISDMPAAAVAAGCEDIASQLVSFEKRLKQRFPESEQINGMEVMMGGGRRHFLPESEGGDRTDKRNLIQAWQQQYPEGHYIEDQAGFDALEPAKTAQLLALFNRSHMQYEADRINNKQGEPSLSEMTAKAIEVLDNNPEGFFLLVEGGRIDHAHHAGNAFNALNDTIELSRAVQTALDKVNTDETLIMVTADHSHVFTMAGYPKRGNPILGKVVNIGEEQPAQAEDGQPYTTLGYANGRGYQQRGDETDADERYHADIHSGRKDLSHIDTEKPGYHQEALVPLSAETHGGEDVAVYAIGPGAAAVSGVNEQHVLFHVITRAAGLD